jgi:inhibitor of KinA
MRIFPLGDSALTIEFGDKMSEALNRRALAFCDRLRADPFQGFIEAVPAYGSASVFYDLIRVRQEVSAFTTAFGHVAELVSSILDEGDPGQSRPRSIAIPVSFRLENGLDLKSAAKLHGLEPEEFVEIFLSRTYRVYMLGFLPGFAYMGKVDKRIATPRKDTPRRRVPNGSVGIAGRQTGVYPFESPGGWQIIGRTDAAVFDLNREEPCIFRPGDEIRFIQLDL